HFGRLIDLFDRRLDRLAHLSYLFGATDEYRSDTHLSRAFEDRQFQPRGRTPAYHAVDSQRANQGAGRAVELSAIRTDLDRGQPDQRGQEISSIRRLDAAVVATRSVGGRA